MRHAKLFGAVGLVLVLAPGLLRGQLVSSEKKNTLNVAIRADLTQMNARVTYVQTVSMTGCSATVDNSQNPVVFNAGAGQDDSALNDLCGETIESEWSVQAVFRNGFTKFTEPFDPTTTGWTQSSAEAHALGTSAYCSTTYKVGTFTANPIPATIDKKAMKDDASVRSAGSQIAFANGYTTFFQDGQMVLDVETSLGCSKGGSATLDSSGLTLLAAPGQTATFSASSDDSGTIFMWSVGLYGNDLQVSGIDPSLFVPIAGGYFLAYDNMPGADVAGNLVGDVELWSTSEVGTNVIPAPNPADDGLRAEDDEP